MGQGNVLSELLTDLFRFVRFVWPKFKNPLQGFDFFWFSKPFEMSSYIRDDATNSVRV